MVEHLKIPSEVINELIKEIERELCPKCKTELEHITVKKEDVFGCPKCKKEIERKKAIKIIKIDRNKMKKK